MSNSPFAVALRSWRLAVLALLLADWTLAERGERVVGEVVTRRVEISRVTNWTADPHVNHSTAADTHAHSSTADAHADSSAADAHADDSTADTHAHSSTAADAHASSSTAADTHADSSTAADTHAHSSTADAHTDSSAADAHADGSTADTDAHSSTAADAHAHSSTVADAGASSSAYDVEQGTPGDEGPDDDVVSDPDGSATPPPPPNEQQLTIVKKISIAELEKEKEHLKKTLAQKRIALLAARYQKTVLTKQRHILKIKIFRGLAFLMNIKQKISWANIAMLGISSQYTAEVEHAKYALKCLAGGRCGPATTTTTTEAPSSTFAVDAGGIDGFGNKQAHGAGGDGGKNGAGNEGHPSAVKVFVGAKKVAEVNTTNITKDVKVVVGATGKVIGKHEPGEAGAGADANTTVGGEDGVVTPKPVAQGEEEGPPAGAGSPANGTAAGSAAGATTSAAAGEGTPAGADASSSGGHNPAHDKLDQGEIADVHPKLDGKWSHMVYEKPMVEEIKGDTIYWNNGNTTKYTWQGDKVAINVSNAAFTATVHKGQLSWSDGDVWTKQ